MQGASLEGRNRKALETGVRFVKEFFTKLATQPGEAAGMYAKDAVLMDGEVFEGAALKRHLQSITGERKYSFSIVLGHPSGNDNVLVIVHGVELTREECVSFSRTFVLAKQGNDFLIQNDVVHVNAGEPEAEASTAPASTPAQPTAPQPVAEKATPKQAPQQPPATQPAQQASQPKDPSAPTSWADKLKLGAGASTASTVQRVIAGQSAEEQEEAQKEEKKAETKKGDSGKQNGTDDKKKQRRSKSPTEKYQYAALYVSHIPNEMTEADIERLFSKFGKIKGKTFKQGHFCFIDFDERSSVQAACSGQITFKGQTLTVQERKSPEQRAAEKQRKETKAASKK